MGKQLSVMCFTLALALGTTGLTFGGTTTDEGPGCGLGKVAWEGSSADENAIGPQLLMSTTNNPFFPLQAFSITSGNLGCRNNGKLWTNAKTTMFAKVNFDNLSQEMAQGGGEHLASLATLMGVPEAKHAKFFAVTQQRYSSLVEAGDTSPVAVIKALNEAIATHPVLAKASRIE